ncbi:MAG: hypothetical protein ABFS23_04510 [Pseudomonadota bacterium]
MVMVTVGGCCVQAFAEQHAPIPVDDSAFGGTPYFPPTSESGPGYGYPPDAGTVRNQEYRPYPKPGRARAWDAPSYGDRAYEQWAPMDTTRGYVQDVPGGYYGGQVRDPGMTPGAWSQYGPDSSSFPMGEGYYATPGGDARSWDRMGGYPQDLPGGYHRGPAVDMAPGAWSQYGADVPSYGWGEGYYGAPGGDAAPWDSMGGYLQDPGRYQSGHVMDPGMAPGAWSQYGPDFPSYPTDEGYYGAPGGDAAPWDRMDGYYGAPGGDAVPWGTTGSYPQDMPGGYGLPWDMGGGYPQDAPGIPTMGSEADMPGPAAYADPRAVRPPQPMDRDPYGVSGGHPPEMPADWYGGGMMQEGPYGQSSPPMFFDPAGGYATPRDYGMPPTPTDSVASDTAGTAAATEMPETAAAESPAEDQPPASKASAGADSGLKDADAKSGISPAR